MYMYFDYFSIFLLPSSFLNSFFFSHPLPLSPSPLYFSFSSLCTFPLFSLSLSLSAPPSVIAHHTTSEPPLILTCIFTGSYGNIKWYREGLPIPANASTGIIVGNYLIDKTFLHVTYYTELSFTDTTGDLGQYRGEYYCGFEALVIDEYGTHNKYEGTLLLLIDVYSYEGIIIIIIIDLIIVIHVHVYCWLICCCLKLFTKAIFDVHYM